jgi:hypothetical protein
MTNTKRRYILLYHNIFSERDWERFGCELFKRQGFEVVPVECVGAVDPAIAARYAEAGVTSMPGVVRVTTRDECLAFLKTVGPSDFVLTTVILTRASAWFFAMLAQLRIRYAVLTLGPVPPSIPWLARTPGVRYTMELMLREARAHLPRYARLLIDLIRPRTGKIALPGPALWIRASERPWSLVDPYPRLWRARSLWTQSFDAERFNSPTRSRKRPADLPPRYAVFLDDGLAGHPDYIYLRGITPFDASYWDMLARFFERLSKKTGLPVIVARHPRATGELPAGLMSLSNRSEELVEHANLVVAHCSTAINFAVLARRPLLFVTTPHLRGTSFGVLTQRFSAWFNQAPINVAHADLGDIQVPAADEKLHARYERNFTCTRSDRSIWHYVFDEAVQWTGLRPNAASTAQNNTTPLPRPSPHRASAAGDR